MQLYKNFCTPTVNENGLLTDFKLNVPENYNFGYDVVDKMAEFAAGDTALVYTNPDKVEKIFTFGDIGRLSNKAANALKAQGIKKGDKVRRGKQTGIVRDIEKEPYIEVKFTDQPVTVFVHESEIVAADSCAADAYGTDAKFQKGDKVRVWQYPVYGKMGEVVEATYGGMEYTVNVEGKDYPRIDYRRIVKVTKSAGDAAEFHVGQRVRAKDPRWAGYQGHALGNGLYTVKKVDSDGTVKLDGFLDVWISPSALVEANDACGKGEDAKNDFANRIMPLVRKIADAQKVIEGVLGEAEDLVFEAAHGEFPDSTFAERSANQLEAACYEAVTALRKVKMIAVF